MVGLQVVNVGYGNADNTTTVLNALDRSPHLGALFGRMDGRPCLAEDGVMASSEASMTITEQTTRPNILTRLAQGSGLWLVPASKEAAPCTEGLEVSLIPWQEWDEACKASQHWPLAPASSHAYPG